MAINFRGKNIEKKTKLVYSSVMKHFSRQTSTVMLTVYGTTIITATGYYH